MSNVLTPNRAFNRGDEIVAIFQNAAGDEFEMVLSILGTSKFVATLYEARGKAIKERTKKA